MANFPVDVSSLIKKLREAMGLTQEELAREIGVSFATVNSWENGKRTPQPFLFRRLLEMEQELAGSKDKKSRTKKSSR